MKKILRIKKTELYEMSFEDVYMKYKRLLIRQSNKWLGQYEYDDLLQVASIGLWKAYDKYENTEVGFGHYAKLIISNQLINYHKANNGKATKRDGNITKVVSLDYVHHDTDGNTFSLKDIVYDDFNIEDHVIENEILDQAYKKIEELGDRDNHIINACLNKSMKQYELGEMYGISQKRVNQIYQRALKNLRQHFENQLGA